MKLSSGPLIGIVGGMGPQAGLDMAEKLIAMTRTQCDQDHIPFLLFSLADSVPDRTQFLIGKSADNPANAIAVQFEAMARLGVSVAVMACNTAHAGAIFDEVLKILKDRNIELKILHLIAETVSFIRRQHPRVRKVGILGTQGTYTSGLYDKAIEKAGLEAILPHPDVRQNDIHAALYAPDFGIKAGQGVVSTQARNRILSAIEHLRQAGAEAIVLGCTELPLAVTEDFIDGIPIIDPAKIMVRRLIAETYPEKQLP